MFDRNYFEKTPHTELIAEINDFSNLVINHPMVIKIVHIDYDIDLDWIKSSKCIHVQGVINYTLDCIDAFTNENFQYSDSIDWNERYSFSKVTHEDSTIINKGEFEILNYLIEQINLNLPYNLIKNSDIIKKYDLKGIYFTQEEYIDENQQKDNQKK